MNPFEAVYFIITYAVLFMLTGYILVLAVTRKDPVLFYFVLVSAAVIWFSPADWMSPVFPASQYPFFNDALHHHYHLIGQILLIVYPLFLRKYRPAWYKRKFVYPFVWAGAFLIAFYGFSYPLRITGITEQITFIASIIAMPLFYSGLTLYLVLKTRSKDIFLRAVVFSPLIWLVLHFLKEGIMKDNSGTQFLVYPPVFLFYIIAFIRQYQKNQIENEKKSKQSFYELYSITPREREIIRCLQAGKSYREIQQELSISFGTVKTHISNIYEKAGVNNRISLVNMIREYEEMGDPIEEML
ncbi:MAG: response regulator transcription factor [Spirochaetia bacterium]